jgi:hypothetical protein
MTPLQHYLLEVRQEVSSLPGTQVELYREQLLTDTRANLRIRLRLADRSLLEISEALVVRQGALTWLITATTGRMPPAAWSSATMMPPTIQRWTLFPSTSMSGRWS